MFPCYLGSLFLRSRIRSLRRALPRRLVLHSGRPSSRESAPPTLPPSLPPNISFCLHVIISPGKHVKATAIYSPRFHGHLYYFRRLFYALIPGLTRYCKPQNPSHLHSLVTSAGYVSDQHILYFEDWSVRFIQTMLHIIYLLADFFSLEIV